MTKGIPVLSASQFDPGMGRVEVTLPEGLSLAEIVRQILPGVCGEDIKRIRVALVSADGSSLIEPALWHAVRPKPGVRVVVRMIPGKGVLRAVLTVVVAIAAVAMGAMFGGPLAAALGITSAAGVSAVGAAIGLGVNVVGTLLINALVPPPKQDQDKAKNSYQISGWKNQYDPDGAIPVVLGALRYAPPFGAMSYSEIDGDQQYIRSLFLFGEGRLNLTDFRIGETSIGEYDEVQLEVRQGIAGQLPVSLYPRQILEEGIGVELARPMPRDDAGNITNDNASIETPVVRTTAGDTESVSIILGWPGGLVRFTDKGKKRSEGVDIKIEQRLVNAQNWQLVDTLRIRAARIETFYRQHTWKFPSRGRWQIRLTMMTGESNSPQRTRTTMWAALQSIRPEYPLAIDRPMAMVAVRVKATHQLAGNLDNFSALASRVCPDWDAASGTWITRETSNPASLYRLVLQHPSNPKAVPNSGLDLPQLQDWHDFCRVKGLFYNRALDQTGNALRDALTEIAAAGRASPRHDGLKWGVVIDRPASLVVDHISPRNSWNFSCRRSYTERPHGLVVRFQDEANDFKETQRVIPWPGHTGPVELTEALDLPGITNARLVYREALRRMYEIMHRPDVYEVTQDGAARVATRGDTIALNYDVLSRVQMTARVLQVQGVTIQLDELVTMQSGRNYAIRFRSLSAADTIGTSHVRIVETKPGETQILTLSGEGAMPAAGDMVLFGQRDRESYQLVVTQTEATEDMCTILRMVDAAPQIDTLTDAAVIPPWSSRVGAEIPENLIAPPAPRWREIFSEVTGNTLAAPIDYLIAAGSGAIRSARFEVDHRLVGASSWTTVNFPAANGGGSITGYINRQNVELRARAISPTGVEGPYGPTVTHSVGSGGTGIPLALDDDSITATALLGGGLIQFATGNDANLDSVQLYRSRSSILDRATDKVGAPLVVSAAQSYSFAVGDTTRPNLLKPNAWSAGDGWTVSGGSAEHAAGLAGDLSQPVTMQTGRWYRLGMSLSGRTAGSVTPELRGGSPVAGAAISGNGLRTDRLQAVSGNNRLALSATAPFDGMLEGLVLYLETAACLAQGTHYLWLEPQSADGLPGPASGPFILEVI